MPNKEGDYKIALEKIIALTEASHPATSFRMLDVNKLAKEVLNPKPIAFTPDGLNVKAD